MADYVFFPCYSEFFAAELLIERKKLKHSTLEPPEFCHGLIAPVILVKGGISVFLDQLRDNGIQFSGIMPAKNHSRDLPDAPPPEEHAQRLLGNLNLSAISPSITDSLRYDVQIVWNSNIRELISYLPGFIKGGAYIPGNPVFTFEEDNRLISISENGFFFSRLEDLPDLWIILRSAIDLVVSAGKSKNSMKPQTEARKGIGAMEVFKLLPGDDCGICGYPSCMEFAVQLFIQKAGLEYCKKMYTPEFSGHLNQMRWLMQIIGIEESL